MDIKAVARERPGGGYRAEVPGLSGVLAEAVTLEDLRPALRSSNLMLLSCSSSAPPRETFFP